MSEKSHNTKEAHDLRRKLANQLTEQLGARAIVVAIIYPNDESCVTLSYTKSVKLSQLSRARCLKDVSTRILEETRLTEGTP